MHGFRVCTSWTLWKRGTFKLGSGLSLAAEQRFNGVKMHGSGVCIGWILWEKGMFRVGTWSNAEQWWMGSMRSVRLWATCFVRNAPPPPQQGLWALWPLRPCHNICTILRLDGE